MFNISFMQKKKGDKDRLIEPISIVVRKKVEL